MKSSTETLIKALEILAQEIQSPDGVANAAVGEAAERLRELSAERDALRVQGEQLQAENKGLLTANSKLCQTKDQQGYVNALEAALDCLQFTALLELDEHDMPNLKTVLLGSMQIRDELGDDANQLRQQAKGE